MKTMGILLILGSVVAGTVLLSDSVPGYFEDRALFARAEARAAVALERAHQASEAEKAEAVAVLEQEVDVVSSMGRARDRRAAEILVIVPSVLAALGAGVLLLRRGLRRQPPKLAAA